MASIEQWQDRILECLAAGKTPAEDLAAQLGLPPFLFADDRIDSVEKREVVAAMTELIRTGTVQYQVQADTGYAYWTGWSPNESGKSSPILTELSAFFRAVADAARVEPMATPYWNVLQINPVLAIQYEWDEAGDAPALYLSDCNFTAVDQSRKAPFASVVYPVDVAEVAAIVRGILDTAERLGVD